MLKECILAAAIVVAPGQRVKKVDTDYNYTIEKGTYYLKIDEISRAESGKFRGGFTATFNFGTDNASFTNIKMITGQFGVISSISYEEAGSSGSNIYLLENNEAKNEDYWTFFVDETQTINFETQDYLDNFTTMMNDYSEEIKGFSLATIFEELAEGLKNLALGFVNAFSGLGQIFYNDGLTYVSIFLIGGVALTIGFWAIDKLLGLGKMGLGSLGKSRAKKSKKGQ